ncbi:hypothetical protein PIB30_034524 [Stylosanthes scabra]|uniref:Uncharacterized protein n=1 Tax=Stylosanthes scabra TaxID=79078 RepID=A0ABU6QDC5_9FABA|nr:hypothetical protein [Stylosanthes scabra]
MFGCTTWIGSRDSSGGAAGPCGSGQFGRISICQCEGEGSVVAGEECGVVRRLEGTVWRGAAGITIFPGLMHWMIRVWRTFLRISH